MSDLTTYDSTRMPVRRMSFYAVSLGLCVGGLVLLSMGTGGHPAGVSLALSAFVGGVVGGWIAVLGRMRDRHLAGRLAHASFVFSAGAVIFFPAVATGAQGSRLLMALIALPMTMCAAVVVFVRSA